MLTSCNYLKKYFNKILIHFFVLSFLLIRPFHIFAQIRDWNDLDGDGPLPANESGNTCLVNGVPTLKCFEVVTANLLFMSNALILLVLFVMFVIGSYRWMLSMGQPEKVESAKKTFTWAIIGLVVYASAYIILFMIDQLFLGGSGDIFRLKIGD
ncbi:hypothetical protein CO051_04100 [Candidatus Roizmanbacteria bacterium CG_4_9_14_0_2_um_filter_39_13]|uniref:Uncharacterized protein n=1 Tax=Candidatus Roizmanbacteria bacterium CG_4_9_14_0_2_um_filter_39_13 TaxID=1974839 RepID=A0A2M8EYE3_9BACT|nr:MAG: hypothetical protein CO051_04100 [Candidatus Roizmanbacteria bacterium CG_4_9_14_0_2_um_filter_39_13]